MLETLASHLETIAAYAPVWGFLLIAFFMAVESSFIPFPSEIVMIPAGFMAIRGELTFHSVWLDVPAAFLAALAGCMIGAYVNYWIGLKLGRTVLHKYCRWFFLKEEQLDRAEALFVKYGEITTFVCRLIPVVRQIISIPAGIARMKLGRFSFFTALGAGIWNAILLAVGIALGSLSLTAAGERKSYLDIVLQGKEMISQNYPWVFAALAVLIIDYLFLHKTLAKKL